MYNRNKAFHQESDGFVRSYEQQAGRVFRGLRRALGHQETTLVVESHIRDRRDIMLDDGQQAIPAVSGGTTSDVRADSSERNREEQQQAVTSTSTQCAGGEIHEPASAIGLAVRSADASAVIPQLQVMASKDQRHQEGNNMGAHDDERETPRVLRACASLGPSSRHASPRAKYQPSTKKEGALPLVNLGKSNTMSPELLQHTFQQQDTFSSESIIAGLCHGRG